MSLWRTHLRAALDRLANMPAAAPSTAYRPRHPERSDFYKIFEQHFERYLSVYDERYEPRWGPLRPVVRPAVERFIDCGRLQGGFARVRCERCGAEHLLAFEIDPTRCHCGGSRRIVAVILDPAVVRKILDHVPKIEARAHAPPPAAG